MNLAHQQQDFFTALRNRVQEKQKTTTDPALTEQLEWFLKCIDEQDDAVNAQLKIVLENARAEVNATIAELDARHHTKTKRI